MAKDRGISKFFRTINDVEEWKQLLTEPDKQWKMGYSARALAYSWQEPQDFPHEVQRLFRNSGIDIFQDIEMLVAFPEYMSLPGRETDG